MTNNTIDYKSILDQTRSIRQEMDDNKNKLQDLVGMSIVHFFYTNPEAALFFCEPSEYGNMTRSRSICRVDDSFFHEQRIQLITENEKKIQTNKTDLTTITNNLSLQPLLEHNISSFQEENVQLNQLSSYSLKNLTHLDIFPPPP